MDMKHVEHSNIVEIREKHQMSLDFLEYILNASIKNVCNCMIGWAKQKEIQKGQTRFQQ